MVNGMSGCIVLDSTAILTLLEKQEGWEEIVDLLLDALYADIRLLFNSVSWGEMLNMAGRTYEDYARAERVIQQIEYLPIQIAGTNHEIERHAASVFRHARLSYAASHAVARTIYEKAELVTRDPVFRRVEDEIPIRWIGERPAEAVD